MEKHKNVSNTAIAITYLYEIFKTEVAEVRDHVRKNLIVGTREEELYKGTMILYSELISNPDFMFIGINPGAKFFQKTGIKYRPEELDPDDEFEYTAAAQYGHDYALARQTRTAFERTRYKDSLSRSVKSNLFYTATSSQKDLCDLLDLLNTKFNVNYYEKSALWTRRLIDLINPKVIICEGKWVVEKLGQYYGVEPQWVNEIAHFQIENGIQVLGYKRRYPDMRNIDEFATALNNLELCRT